MDYLEGLLLDSAPLSAEPAPAPARERIEASTSETEVLDALNAEPSAQVRAQLAPLAIQRLGRKKSNRRRSTLSSDSHRSWSRIPGR